mmetsp:Transcript_47090/g.52656  ORF Transcript_47090/g.52656 Transcript_47090/m.52656 type:complete len:82 (-) Transcript_47090:28-273(-)
MTVQSSRFALLPTATLVAESKQGVQGTLVSYIDDISSSAAILTRLAAKATKIVAALVNEIIFFNRYYLIVKQCQIYVWKGL